MKRATEADERGDEMAQINVVLDMIDALVDATPDAYDADWWDDRASRRSVTRSKRSGQSPQGETRNGGRRVRAQ